MNVRIRRTSLRAGRTSVVAAHLRRCAALLTSSELGQALLCNPGGSLSISLKKVFEETSDGGVDEAGEVVAWISSWLWESCRGSKLMSASEASWCMSTGVGKETTAI